MNISVGRLFAVFFIACFFGLQLCQANALEPAKQGTPSYYITDSETAGVSLPVYPPLYKKIQAQQNEQKIQLSQQKQYQQAIEQQAHYLFVYDYQQTLQLRIFEQKLLVLFVVQQYIHDFIRLHPSSIYRLLQPDTDPELHIFSLV